VLAIAGIFLVARTIILSIPLPGEGGDTLISGSNIRVGALGLLRFQHPRSLLSPSTLPFGCTQGGERVEPLMAVSLSNDARTDRTR
jgi:hypothetical protein